MRFVYRGRGGHGDTIMASTNDVNCWYGRNTPERVIFNPGFRVKPGNMTVEHEHWARPYAGRLMVEPHIKGRFSGENKRWPWDKWQALVDRCGVPCVQCLKPGTRALERVLSVDTPSFEHAVSVLWHSLALVATDGGLHHAAGALRVPAVVLWGAYSSPKTLGYDWHINIEEPDALGLGQRKTHPACVAAMERISVARVLEGVGRCLL